MKDMKKLSSVARELVRASSHATDPTESDKERNLTALRAQLAAGAPTHTHEPTPTVAPAASRPLWTFVSGAAAGGGLIASLFFLSESNEGDSPPDSLPPKLEVEQVESPREEAEPDGAPQPKQVPKQEILPTAEVASKAPRPRPPSKPASNGSTAIARETTPVQAPASSDLAKEVALLSKATSALRSGRAQEALSFLSQHQKQFPTGALGRERRSARAQALCQLGRKDEARQVLQSLPASSPLGARAKRACKFD